mgnify:CR=1 FL=1|jgi:Ca2+-binding EF-hand superfamily protein
MKTNAWVSIACLLVSSACASAQQPPPTQQQRAVDDQQTTQAQQAHASFSDLDKDKDGRLSQEEAGKAVVGFAAMDANGDGYISDAEYRAQAKDAGKMDEGKPNATSPDKAP